MIRFKAHVGLHRAPDAAVLLLCLGALGFTGCGQAPAPDPITADCDNVVVAKDSFSVQLLEFRATEGAISLRKAASPKDRVVMSAVFHCATGQLLFGTWKKMTSSPKAELHFMDARGEVVVNMDAGLNSIVSLPGGAVLAQTAAIKRGSLDPVPGVLSAPEGGSEVSLPGPAQHDPHQDMPVQGQIFVEDIFFDAAERKDLRRIRGSIGRRELRSGKLLSYAMDQRIYEVDLATGQNTRIHDYRPAYTFGVPIAKLPGPTYYFSIDGDLYAVAGTKHEPSTKGYLPSNRIYRHDAKDRQWVETAALAFEPKWGAADNGRVIALGEAQLAVYGTKSKSLTTTAFEFGPYRPTSLARIGQNWALAVAAKEDASRSAPDDAQIWIVSGDFSRVLLKHPMPGFGRLVLTSEATPTPVHAW